MASITIRNLDDQIKEQLRIAAAHNGHSMEEEARLILGKALASVNQTGSLGSRIRNRFSASGGVELDLLLRQEKATAVANCEARGRSVSMADAQIAASCRAHGASISTRNVRDFEFSGVEVINPWQAEWRV